jgi:DNA-directed RNA polymerase specialized sigma24 family protein
MPIKKFIRDMSTEELIDLCIDQGDRQAWDEFFRRYLPTIISAIKKTLRNNGQYNLANDKEVVSDINEKIIFKLYCRDKLRKCKDVSGITFWLDELAKNQTIDWLVRRGRAKRITKAVIDDTTISLTDNIEIPPPSDIPELFPDSNESEDFFERLRAKINAIKNEKDRWVFRISVINVLPLDNQELSSLAKFSGLPLNKLKDAITPIIIDVQAKEEVKAKNAGDAIILWYQIGRLQAVLYEERKNTTDYNKEKIVALENKLRKKIQTREKKLKTINKISWPSGKKIAALLGFKQGHEGQISGRRGRSRNAIKTR